MKHAGRPRVDPNDDSVQLNLTLSAKQYDQIYRAARRADVSIPEVIRQALARATIREPDAD